MIVFMDGFDHYATADILKKWDSLSGTPVITAAAGRNSSAGMQFDGSEYVEKNVSGTPATLIVAAAFKASSLSVSQDVVRFMDSTTTQVKIRIRTDGKIEAFRDTTSLGASAGTVFTAGAFAHLDIKVNIHPSTGSVLVQSGGATVLNLTSQNTRASANSQVTSVRIGGDGTNTVTVDDLYILDTTGAAPQNDQLGDCRIDVSVPNAESTYSDFTPLSGSDNSAMVDESAPDGDTTYNSSGAVGARDSFGMTVMADIGGATIFGVQANVVARKDASGTRKVRALARPAGINHYGTSESLTTSYLDYRTIWQTNPETSAEWAENEVNLTQFGYEVAS